jgi:hypothetical protein
MPALFTARGVARPPNFRQSCRGKGNVESRCGGTSTCAYRSHALNAWCLHYPPSHSPPPLSWPSSTWHSYTYTGGRGGRAIQAMVQHDLAPEVAGMDSTCIEKVWTRMEEVSFFCFLFLIFYICYIYFTHSGTAWKKYICG